MTDSLYYKKVRQPSVDDGKNDEIVQLKSCLEKSRTEIEQMNSEVILQKKLTAEAQVNAVAMIEVEYRKGRVDHVGGRVFTTGGRESRGGADTRGNLDYPRSKAHSSRGKLAVGRVDRT